MPARLLREGILDSEAVCSLDFPAEVFYRRLMSVVDDFGRYDGRPGVLRSRLYPLQVDKVREADITRWIAACVKAGVIALYDASGKQYILFKKLGSPRNKESKWPPPPPGVEAEPQRAIENNCTQLKADANGCVQLLADAPGSGSGSGTGSSTGSGAGAEKSGEPAEPVSPPPVLVFPTRGDVSAWALTQSQIDEWGRAYPGLDVLAECRKAHAWVDAATANRKTAGGMKKFLVGWLNRTADRGGGRPATVPRAGPPPAETMAQRVDRLEAERLAREEGVT